MDKLKKDSSKKNKKKQDDELEAMRKEIEELKKKEGDKAEDDALLQELQDQIKQMEEEDKKDDKHTQKSHDELKAEIERLRAEIKDMQDEQENTKKEETKVEYNIPEQGDAKKVGATVGDKEVEKYDVKMKPLNEDEGEEEVPETGEVTPVQEKGIDIDTAMPYGDLEPFGREDTAQELTENAVTESDEMVDQLERAEVSEEKRSVFL